MAQQLSMFDRPSKAVSQSASIKGCSLIYTPRGRAREYASLACNIYSGCDHGCVYCYAPSVLRRSRSDFADSNARKDFLRKLEKEAAKYAAIGATDRILLCFTCDPYQLLDIKEQMTRKTIELLKDYGLNVQTLTKGGGRALRDLDLLTPQDAFGTTLTLLDNDESRKWEPRAALPRERIRTIRRFHEAGIPTWMSLEPVLNPDVALEIIQQTHHFVDVFKVGKLNYHPLAQQIDWHRFAHNAVDLLKSIGYQQNIDSDRLQPGQFYVKRDLVRYL